MVSVLALSVTFGATSPKERGLGSPFAQKEKEKFTKKAQNRVRSGAKCGIL